ncbi:MAG: HEAT repeat domain-containing protein [Vicinamibacteria bacterium]
MIVEVLVLAAVAIGAAAYTRRIRVPAPPVRASDWMHVVRRAGVAELDADSDTSFGGRDEGLAIRVDVFRDEAGVAASVAISGLAPEIGLQRVEASTRLLEAMGVRDLEVGDPAFDADLLLASAKPLLARALLDAETRAGLRAAFAGGYPLSVGRGALKATLRHASSGPGFDADTLRTLIALAHRLEPVRTPELRLARIVRSDPLAAVRAAALGALLESAPRHQRTLEAVRAATKDADPAIRLRAAVAQGAEGVPVLQALAGDAGCDDAIGAEAVTALGTRLPLEAAIAAVDRAARGERLRTGLAAVGVLTEKGSPTVEPVLVAALHAPDPTLAAAAASALGACGSVAAVPDLARAEEREPAVRRAAREAVAAIQSRLTGATPGQVSLASGEAGQVGLADAADGRVSLGTDES